MIGNSAAGSNSPSLTQNALSALIEGRDVGEVIGEPSAEPVASSPEPEAAPEETPEASSETEATPETKPEDSEELILSDENGRRKVKIDWNDREKLKKYVQMAHGARKWQAERDQTRQAFEKYKSEASEKVSTYDALNQAWSTGGQEALINLLTGSPQGYAELEKSIVAKYQFLAQATPEQKEAFEARQKNAELQRKMEQLLADTESRKQEAEAQKAAAQAKEVESMVHPAFEKYRFQGKLGDAAIEHSLDEAIWTQTLARLERLPEEQISQAVIDREFRTVAATFNKAIGKQAQAKAKEVVNSKKVDAKEALTNAAIKGMKQTENGAQVRDKVGRGDIKGALLDMLSGRKV